MSSWMGRSGASFSIGTNVKGGMLLRLTTVLMDIKAEAKERKLALEHLEVWRHTVNACSSFSAFLFDHKVK